MNELLRAFVFLFAVIDPIGTVPIFLHATRDYDDAARKKIALRAVIVATCILLFFILVGQYLIEAMEITLPAFQISGGIILFIFALTMVFGSGKHGVVDDKEEDMHHVSVFPIALPAIASPGAITAVVLLTDNHIYTFGQQMITTGIVLVILAIVYILLLIAGRIQKSIGKMGITVITKIMGLLLCAIAIESVLAGLKAYFKIG